VLELSGLRAHYKNEKEGQERLANLDELVNAAENFVAEEGTPDQDAEGEFGTDLPPSWPTPRWKPANTRPARATTPCN
jgi:superfamily I DNA/RNA helicase